LIILTFAQIGTLSSSSDSMSSSAGAFTMLNVDVRRRGNIPRLFESVSID
jgi:hypothetical protein